MHPKSETPQGFGKWGHSAAIMEMTDEQAEALQRGVQAGCGKPMEHCKTITGLAKELGIRRKFLYQWLDQLRAGGKAALERRRGRLLRNPLYRDEQVGAYFLWYHFRIAPLA
jgi:transposase-like protein